MVVVGGIYSPNQHSSRWLTALSMGTPDTVLFTVRCVPHQLVVEVVCLFGAPDSPVAHRTVQCDLTSQTVF
jgi:hypothetical protein